MSFKTRHYYVSALTALLLLCQQVVAADKSSECKKHFDDANYQQAFSPCQLSAQQGDAMAQTLLGEMYDQGLAVEKNPSQAAEWWQAAAQQGYLPAQNLLALKYYYGGDVFGPQPGWSQDYKKAAQLWRQSALKGVPSSQFMLGVMLMEGQGTDRDYVEAYAWFKLASQGGYKLATDTLIELSPLMSTDDKQAGQIRFQQLSQQLQQPSQ